MARALCWLARPAIIVQKVPVADGANVTQHPSVIVSDKGTAATARQAPRTVVPGPDKAGKLLKEMR